jgi:hypothetical protein
MKIFLILSYIFITNWIIAYYIEPNWFSFFLCVINIIFILPLIWILLDKLQIGKQFKTYYLKK